MARIWKEPRSGHWSAHFDLHGYQGLPGHDVSPDPAIVPVNSYFVRVCGFTFVFGSVAQIETVLAYYNRRIHPSSRLPDSEWLRAEHEVVQRWFERLPQYLLEEPKRVRVVKALERALSEFDGDAGRSPVQESRASRPPIIPIERDIDPPLTAREDRAKPTSRRPRRKRP